LEDVILDVLIVDMDISLDVFDSLIDLHHNALLFNPQFFIDAEEVFVDGSQFVDDCLFLFS
jgi:hypothetical protein